MLEKIIGLLSPAKAAERARNRLLLDIYEGRRTFEAATKGRRGTNWNAYGESDANTDIARSLVTLRERSRALYKNNPYARKAVRTIGLNTIGTGIQPVPRSNAPNAAQAAKELWRQWAETTACDFYGRKNIYGLQMLAWRTVALSGEVLVLRKRDAKSPTTFRLQLLEGDFLDLNKSSITGAKDGNYIVQGVEFDKEGRRVAYWIFDQPPSDLYSLRIDSKRVPAEDVIHIFEEERPGQIRGVPFLASVMLRLRDFDDYEDAQLMRQKIAACFSVFITQSQNPMAGLSGEPSELERERVEPGIIERLNPGESVTLASPPGAEGYADYSRKIQQGMAAGAGITYEQMTGDLSNVNFSSGRMGWIEAQRQIEDWQYNTFIPLFCAGVWEWLVTGMKAKGVLPASASLTAEWTPQGRFMIDPAKEVKATAASLASGLTSWSEAVRLQGYDPDTLLEQLKEDAEKLKVLGIPFEWLFGKSHAEMPTAEEQ